MAQVPYQPVPEVTPSDQGIHLGESPAIPSAFGINVSQAVEGFGSTLERSGNELATRALAIQQARNEADADSADVEFMKQAGKAHAWFNSLEGKERVDAFDGHMKNLEDIRNKIGESLTNINARRLYDRQSRGTMGRTIFNAAGAAATADKQYIAGTAAAQMELDAQQVENDPNNRALFDDKVTRTQANAQRVAAVKGFPVGSPEEQLLTKQAISKLYLQRYTGLSKVDPFTAKKELDADKTNLMDADRLKAEQIITTQGRAVGSANIANQVIAAGAETPEKPGKTLAVMEQEARDMAKKQFPNDPIMAEHAATTVATLWNKDKAAVRQEDLSNDAIVTDRIAKGVKDVQDLRSDPKAAAAMDALPSRTQITIPGRIKRYNEARDYNDAHDSFRKLWGLSNNDLKQFVETDFTDPKFKLSQRQMDELERRKQSLIAKPTQDPRVNTALETMRGSHAAELEALGIHHRTEKNKDDYDHYTGMLQQAIDSWQQDKGKAPTQKEISETIGPQVIQQSVRPGFFGMAFGGNKKAFFDIDTSTDAYTKFVADQKALAVKDGRPEPSDELLYRAAQRMEYIKYHGKKKEDKGG
ncbi:MAG TPA: hypothetical protein VLG09_04330 [Candidatus Saccharimonadales bacterium]|nr:hypothetical protein [Candidatus Saccharimonadales bacterium]